jgi:fatty acid desaturase
MTTESHAQAIGVDSLNAPTLQASLAALYGDRSNVALVEMAITFAIIGGAVYLLGFHPGVWSYGFGFLCIGLMQYRIVIACHEAVHKKLLFPLKLNETVGATLCALVGINLLWYRLQHLGHHAAQELDEDTDAYIYAPILRQPPGMLRLLIWIFGTVPEILVKIRQKAFKVNVTADFAGRALLHSLGIVGVQAVLFASCVFWLSWWHYFAFWLTPLLTIAVFMNRTRVLVEHGYAHVPLPHNAAQNPAPVKTIDFSATAIERFLIAPFRFDYHFAHHRAPSIPYYRARDLSRLLEKHGITPPSASHPTYMQGLRHVLFD